MALSSEMINQFVSALKVLSDEANKAREQYKNATSKPDESWKAVSEAHPDHEAVVAFNEYAEKVEAKIKELQALKGERRKAAIAAVTGETTTDVSEDDAKALKDAFLEARRMFKATYDNTLIILGGDETALKSLMAEAGIQDIPNLGGGAAKSSGGDIVRLRISDAWVDGEPFADANGKVSLTTLATHLKVDADKIREAAAKAGNVSSVRDLPKGQDVSFDLTIGDETKNVVIRPAVPGKKSE